MTLLSIAIASFVGLLFLGPGLHLIYRRDWDGFSVWFISLAGFLLLWKIMPGLYLVWLTVFSFVEFWALRRNKVQVPNNANIN